MRELRVDGIRTVLREAGPANDREAAFIHGNPGSSGDWASLLDRAGGPCRAVAWDPRLRQRQQATRLPAHR
jgi:pimeloyl-ACP methyl ester carboxylesterase